METSPSANSALPIDRFLLRILYDQDLRLKLEYGCSDDERLTKFVELGRMANFDIRPKDLLNKFGVKAEDSNAGHLVVRGQGTEELTVEWRTPEGSSLPTIIHLQKTTPVEDSFDAATPADHAEFTPREGLFATVWLAAYADERISPPELDEIQSAGMALFGVDDPIDIENRLYDLLHREGPTGIANRILCVAQNYGPSYCAALFRAAVRVVKSDEKIVVSESKFLKTLAAALQLNADDQRFLHLAAGYDFYGFNFADALPADESVSVELAAAAAFYWAAGEKVLFSDGLAAFRSWIAFAAEGLEINDDIYERLVEVHKTAGIVGWALMSKAAGLNPVVERSFVAGMMYSFRFSDTLYGAFRELVGTQASFCEPEILVTAADWTEKRRSALGDTFMGCPIAPPLPRNALESSAKASVNEKYLFLAAAVGLVVAAFRFKNLNLLDGRSEIPIFDAAALVASDLKRPRIRNGVMNVMTQMFQNLGPYRAARVFYVYLKALAEHAPELKRMIYQVFACAWEQVWEWTHERQFDESPSQVYETMFESIGFRVPDDDDGFLPTPSSAVFIAFNSRSEAPNSPAASPLEPVTQDEAHESEFRNPLSDLAAFFQRRNWMIKIDYDDPGIHTTYSGNNGQFNCFAKLRLEQSQLVFYSIFPIRTPLEKRKSMAEFITRANFGMVIGNFELDFSDGEVRYKSSVDFEEIGLPDKMLENLIHANILTMDRYLSGLYAIIYSDRDPAEVINEIETGR
jgi:hypothetical protein